MKADVVNWQLTKSIKWTFHFKNQTFLCAGTMGNKVLKDLISLDAELRGLIVSSYDRPLHWSLHSMDMWLQSQRIPYNNKRW